MVMEKFNFFKNFKICWWGATMENWKIWPIEKKIGDLYELDNFKKRIFFEKKIFKIEIANVIFSTDF